MEYITQVSRAYIDESRRWAYLEREVPRVEYSGIKAQPRSIAFGGKKRDPGNEVV